MASKAQIPKGWRQVRLRDVADVVMGQSPPGALVLDLDGLSANDGGLPFIQGNAEFGARYPVPLKWSLQTFKRAETGDALISVRAPVGETNRVSQRLCIGRGLAAVRFKKADQQCGWHILNHSKGTLERVAQGSTFQAIAGPDLRNLPIHLPPLREQRAIAAVLDGIDIAIECTDEFIAVTEHLRDSLLHELLTRGVPGWHSAWRDARGVGTIPADWEVVRLADVAEVVTGSTPPREISKYYGGNVPWIKPSDLALGRLVGSSEESLTEAGVQVSRQVPENSILVSCIGTIGEVAISRMPLCFNQQINTLIPGAKVLPPYLYWGCNYQANYMLSISAKTAVPILNKTAFSGVSIPLPALAEQRAIAAVLDGVDATIERTHEERDRLQSLKAAAADALLTGRVRVGGES